MKVGIITITDGANYGNRLQNYAVQQLVKSLGVDAETIRRSTKRDLSTIQKCIFLVKEIIKKIIGKKNTHFCFRKRKKRFCKFNKERIAFSNLTLKNNKAPKGICSKYDYFLCGSDQIWNANFEIVSSDIMNHLASFAEPNQRIAFAASFGTDRVAPEYENIFKKELCKFKAIAVREEAGKRIVDELTMTNRSIVVLDPTLLIGEQEWLNLEKKPSYLEAGEYVLTYFLGKKNALLEKKIDEIAKSSKLNVINLGIEFLTDDRIVNLDHFCTSPDEFVWLIHNATYVLTDSYHASIFSIIFNRPFLCYDRTMNKKGNEMNSRIDTLLSRFNLEYCKDDIENPQKFPRCKDYSGIYSILNDERDKAISFLREALEI